MPHIDEFWDEIADEGLVDFDQAGRARARFVQIGGGLDTAVLENAPLDPAGRDKLLEIAARVLQKKLARPMDISQPDRDAIQHIPRPVIDRYGVMPARDDKGRLILICPPLAPHVFNELKVRLGRSFDARLALEMDLRLALARHFDVPLPSRFEALRAGRRPGRSALSGVPAHRPLPVRAAPEPRPSTDGEARAWLGRASAALRLARDPAALVELLARAGADVLDGRFYLLANGRDALRCVGGTGLAGQGPTVSITPGGRLAQALTIGTSRLEDFPRDADLTVLYAALDRPTPARIMIEPIRDGLEVIGVFVGDHGSAGIDRTVVGTLRRWLSRVSMRLADLRQSAAPPPAAREHTRPESGPPMPERARPPRATSDPPPRRAAPPSAGPVPAGVPPRDPFAPAIERRRRHSSSPAAALMDLAEAARAAAATADDLPSSSEPPPRAHPLGVEPPARPPSREPQPLAPPPAAPPRPAASDRPPAPRPPTGDLPLIPPPAPERPRPASPLPPPAPPEPPAASRARSTSSAPPAPAAPDRPSAPPAAPAATRPRPSPPIPAAPDDLELDDLDPDDALDTYARPTIDARPPPMDPALDLGEPDDDDPLADFLSDPEIEAVGDALVDALLPMGRPPNTLPERPRARADEASAGSIFAALTPSPSGPDEALGGPPPTRPARPEALQDGLDAPRPTVNLRPPREEDELPDPPLLEQPLPAVDPDVLELDDDAVIAVESDPPRPPPVPIRRLRGRKPTVDLTGPLDDDEPALDPPPFDVDPAAARSRKTVNLRPPLVEPRDTSGPPPPHVDAWAETAELPIDADFEAELAAEDGVPIDPSAAETDAIVIEAEDGLDAEGQPPDHPDTLDLDIDGGDAMSVPMAPSAPPAADAQSDTVATPIPPDDDAPDAAAPAGDALADAAPADAAPADDAPADDAPADDALADDDASADDAPADAAPADDAPADAAPADAVPADAAPADAAPAGDAPADAASAGDAVVTAQMAAPPESDPAPATGQRDAAPNEPPSPYAAASARADLSDPPLPLDDIAATPADASASTSEPPLPLDAIDPPASTPPARRASPGDDLFARAMRELDGDAAADEVSPARVPPELRFEHAVDRVDVDLDDAGDSVETQLDRALDADSTPPASASPEPLPELDLGSMDGSDAGDSGELDLGSIDDSIDDGIDGIDGSINGSSADDSINGSSADDSSADDSSADDGTDDSSADGSSADDGIDDSSADDSSADDSSDSSLDASADDSLDVSLDGFDGSLDGFDGSLEDSLDGLEGSLGFAVDSDADPRPLDHPALDDEVAVAPEAHRPVLASAPAPSPDDSLDAMLDLGLDRPPSAPAPEPEPPAAPAFSLLGRAQSGIDLDLDLGLELDPVPAAPLEPSADPESRAAAPSAPPAPVDPAALDAHVGALGDPDRADAAEAALLAAGEAGLDALFRAFPGQLVVDRYTDGDTVPVEKHSRVLAAIARFGDAAGPRLAARCEHLAPDVRYYAVYMFTAVRHLPSVAAITPCLTDSDGSVRAIAVRVAHVFRRDDIFTALVTYLVSLVERGRLADRRAAAETLGHLYATAAAPSLIAMLGAPQPPLRDAAHRALVEIARQDLGHDVWRWRTWFERNADRPRVEWLLDGLLSDKRTIRRGAFRELRRLTHLNFGYVPDAPPDARRAAVAAWTRWWQQTGQQQYGDLF